MASKEHIEEFLKALKGERGDLDAWLECNDEAECRAAILRVIDDACAIEVARLEYRAGLLAAWLQWCLENCDGSPEWIFGNYATDSMRALLAGKPAKMPDA